MPWVNEHTESSSGSHCPAKPWDAAAAEEIPFSPLCQHGPVPAWLFPVVLWSRRRECFHPCFTASFPPRLSAVGWHFPEAVPEEEIPNASPFAVFSGSFACTGATGPDLQLVTGLFFCLKKSSLFCTRSFFPESISGRSLTYRDWLNPISTAPFQHNTF